MRVAPTAVNDGIKFDRPFPKLGITMEGILGFIDKVGADKLKGLTTTQVSPFVLELTKNHQCSYCDEMVELSSIIKTANVFISHAWKYQFLNVVSALQNHYKDKSKEQQQHIVFWFDLFSNNQHGLDSGTPPPFSWWCNTFMTAIKQIGTVVMVVEPWSNPVTLTRVWCLWEVYCASATNSKFEIAMSESETAVYRQQIVSDTNGFIRMLSNIDVRNSDAFNPLDKQQIFEVINSTVGFPKLNAMVLSTVRKWALKDLSNYLTSLQSAAEGDTGSVAVADVCAVLGEIGLKADLNPDGILKKWLKEAHRLRLLHLGEKDDRTLHSLGNLAKVNSAHYNNACEQLLTRYGDTSVLYWDVVLSRKYNSIKSVITMLSKVEVTQENAYIAADLVYRALMEYEMTQNEYTRCRANLENAVSKLRDYLPQASVTRLKLEIILIAKSTKPSAEDFQMLKQYTTRLKETLGYDHSDVNKAFVRARNVAFDCKSIEYQLDFTWEHMKSGIVLFDWMELMADVCMLAYMPCHCFRCQGEMCRAFCVLLPVCCVCCVPAALAKCGILMWCRRGKMKSLDID